MKETYLVTNPIIRTRTSYSSAVGTPGWNRIPVGGRGGVFRAAAAAMLFVPVFVVGCATVADSELSVREGRTIALGEDVDPARAYLSLSEIKPPPPVPEHRTTDRPLSARAARQIELARQLENEQRFAEASIELERALRYDPNHPRIHRAMALLNWNAGNVELARSNAARALEARPDDALSHYIIGRCDMAGGSFASAITSFRTAMECGGYEDAPYHAALCKFYLAEALSKEGYLEAALRQYADFEGRAEGIVQSEDNDKNVRGLTTKRTTSATSRASILERLGRFADAAAALSPIVAAFPDDLNRGIHLARLLMLAGRFDDALAAARGISSDDEAVIKLIGEIHERAGHPEQVIDDLRRRHALRPDAENVVLFLADALAKYDRLDEARDELMRFLGTNPVSDRARAKLADVLMAIPDWQGVLQTLAEWIDRRPENSETVESKLAKVADNRDAVNNLLRGGETGGAGYAFAYLRGVLAAKSDRLDRAEDLLRASVAANGEFVPARAALAHVYLRRHKYEQALAVAARPHKEVAQDSRLERVLGLVYLRLDEFDQAELHLKAAIQLNRADTETMLELAKLHNDRGHRLRAIRQLRALLEENPLHEDAREMLAAAYLHEGELDATVEQLEKLRTTSTTPTTRARCEAFLAQLKTPDPEAYRRVLLDAMDRSGQDAKTWLAIAESYQSFDDAANMRVAYQNALAADPDNEDAAMGLVQAEKRLLQFKEAAARLRAMLPIRPNRHSWRFELIDLYLNVQDYDAALALARSQVAGGDLDDATRRRYRMVIAETLFGAGEEDEALRLMEEWSRENPDDSWWSLRLAREYRRLDREPEAVRIYERVFKEDGKNLVDLADALIAAGRSARAGQYVLDRLADDPDSDDMVALLAYVLAASERSDDAIELLRNKLLRTLQREHLQNRLIIHLRIADRDREGVDFIESLIDEVMSAVRSMRDRGPREPLRRLTDEEIARRPDEPFSMPGLHARLRELRLELARSLIAAEEFHDAQHQLTSWIESARDPKEKVDFLELLAVCHQLRGDETRAAETYERVLAIVPDDAGLNNNVAYTWIDRGVRLDEAERMVRRALWRSPRQAAYLDTFGWLLYKRGLFEEARMWLERAHRAMATPDPVVLDHLGDDCWRLGLAEEAIKYWTAAVDAVGKDDEEGYMPGDRRRVKDSTPRKIKDARSGAAPNVEPLAVPAEEKAVEDSDTG